MKIIDLISKLSAIASSYGADSEVLIETGNLNHVEWEFDTKTKNVVLLRLDMSDYEEAQAELLPNSDFSYKLSIHIEDYDDDFCLVRDGSYVAEGSTLHYFGSTVAECYENFSRSTWVGHRSCLDRDAELGSGYHHVTHFRDLFGRDLRELLVNSKRVGYFKDWFFFDYVRDPEGIRAVIESGDFASHHGGNQEFEISVSKLTQINKGRD